MAIVLGAPGGGSARAAHGEMERALSELLAEIGECGPSDPQQREWLRRRAAFLLARVAAVDPDGAAESAEAATLTSWLRSTAPEPARPVRPPPMLPASRTGGSAAPATGWWGSTAAVLMAGLLGVVVGSPLVGLLFGWRLYVVLTGSMTPTLPVGTLMVSAPVEGARVAVGDIVSFARPDRPAEVVTHRVASIEVDAFGRYFRTRGDANPVADSWRVPASGRVWRPVAIVPWLGAVAARAADPEVRAVTIVLPSILLGAFGLASLWRGAPASAAA
jgi:signal peptidase